MAYAIATIASRKGEDAVHRAASRHDLEAALEWVSSRMETAKAVDRARSAMQVHQRRHRIAM